VEGVGEAVHRVTMPEKVIGCENCHGPGSLHQDLHRSGRFVPGAEDLTIVNPGKLPRPLLEDICANCHQNGIASVLLRGRQHSDFRPGRPLTDYRIDYQFDVGNEQMTVVGHMEQLRRSACYQQSAQLSCLTCHDPHARHKPQDPVAFYRQKCLSCHSEQHCRLDQAARRKKDATDNCVACHMPRGDTDIPHIAFTHHRIGRHPAPQGSEPGRLPELLAVGDLTLVPPLDRQRNLGLAYVVVSQHPSYRPLSEVFRQRAEELLTTVHDAGLRQDDTTAALVELYRERDPSQAKEYFKELLQSRGVTPQLRTRVQFTAAASEMQAGNIDSAIPLLEELTRVRRSADDWRLLGLAHLEQNHPDRALAAYKQALAIRPFRPSIHFGLAEAYRRLGETALAQEHLDKAQWLAQHNQD
jgi:tetratricopeptide (TPR) repeat protein